MKRTFVAIKVKAGETLRELTGSLKNELSGDLVRWVDLNQVHITLAFLGDTGDLVLEKVKRLIDEIAGENEEFTFILSGLGVFGKHRDPKVIWVGVEACKELEALSEQLKKGLKEMGALADDKPFSPHLTLGRVKYLKDISALDAIINKYRGAFFQKVVVYEIIFYESISGSTGPVYKALHKANLQSACL